MKKRRAYTGVIRCEFCPQTIRGGSKGLLFSNYISHVESKHPTYQAVPGYQASIMGAEPVAK